MYQSRALTVSEVLLLVAGLAQVLAPRLIIAAVGALAWMVLSVVYIIGSLRVARRDRPGEGGGEGAGDQALPEPRTPASRLARLRQLSDLTPLLAALTGLITAVIHLNDPTVNVAGTSLVDEICRLYLILDRSQALTVLIGVPGWMVLHIGFAQMYERYDQLESHRGFRFPGTETPTSVEYLYLGMTIGATFATSDVEVRSSRTRWIVMTHTVLAFLYNAIVVGVVVKLLTDG